MVVCFSLFGWLWCLVVCGVICCEFVCLSAWLVGYVGFLVFRVLGLLCYCLWVTSVV